MAEPARRSVAAPTGPADGQRSINAVIVSRVAGGMRGSLVIAAHWHCASHHAAARLTGSATRPRLPLDQASRLDHPARPARCWRDAGLLLRASCARPEVLSGPIGSPRCGTPARRAGHARA